jgi:3-phosphoglycerate kinase
VTILSGGSNVSDFIQIIDQLRKTGEKVIHCGPRAMLRDTQGGDLNEKYGKKG